MAKLKIKIKNVKSIEEAKSALDGGAAKVSRAAFKSPESAYKKGSAGSRVETDNPPLSFSDNVVAQAPAETDMPFASNPVVDNRIHDDSPEMVRRKNAKARDCRNGYRVTDNRVYADSD
jgi:hypothetical protein